MWALPGDTDQEKRGGSGINVGFKSVKSCARRMQKVWSLSSRLELEKGCKDSETEGYGQGI